MKVDRIPSAWLQSEGRRLDCGPYMSGARKARLRLESIKVPKAALKDLTLGGVEGIINAGRIKRMWVDDPEFGLPFLSSTDILQADLSNLRLISRKAMRDNPKLVVSEGWTLITRSGTIGRTAYARSDMDGMACSEDVLRVVPDPVKIPPGYLYAYLSSKFGVPLIVEGTYGAIIQHIEPHHIAQLPVPRLGRKNESAVDAMVQKAAWLRAESSIALSEAMKEIESKLKAPGHTEIKCDTWRGQAVSIARVRGSMRFDAFFYNPVAVAAEQWAIDHPNGSWRLGDVANVFDVPPFKHIYVEREHGLPFFTSGDLFKLDKVVDKYLSKSRTRDLHKYVIDRGWVLLARSGQLGGIIGNPQFADSAMAGATSSDHVIRIVPRQGMIPSGYLYAYLATKSIGYPLLTRTMTGASIPALWPKFLNHIPVVKADTAFMKEVDLAVSKAFEQRVEATRIESAAKERVEKHIEELS